MDRLREKRRREAQFVGSTTGEGGSFRSALRKAILAVGVVGLAYLAARRFGASGGERSPRTGEAGTDVGESGVSIELDEGSGTGGEDDENDGEHDANLEKGDDADLPGRDRSSTEIQERAEEDAHEQPAEPGEMTVDEDVVEDVIDEEESDEEESDE